MRNIVLILFLMSASLHAWGYSVTAGDPNYRSGVMRCEGSIIGAKRIDILERYDGTFDVTLSGGGVISDTFNFRNPLIHESMTRIEFKSQDGNAYFVTDLVKRRSVVRLKAKPQGFGFGSTVNIDSKDYDCNRLIIAQ